MRWSFVGAFPVASKRDRDVRGDVRVYLRSHISPCTLYTSALSSRHVIPPSPADAIRPVEKITPVAERRLGVLIDRHDDRLHMRVAPAFARGLDADFRERIYPWRVIRVVVVPSKRC